MEQSFRKYFELEESPDTEQDKDSTPSGEDISPEAAPLEDDTPIQDLLPADNPSQAVPSKGAMPQENTLPAEETHAQTGSEDLPAVAEDTVYAEK